MKKHLSFIAAIATALMFGKLMSSVVAPEYGVAVGVVSTTLALFFAFFVGLPQGALGNTPAATAGEYSGAYLSLQDIGMPKWYPKLVAQYGDQGAEVVGMVQALGWNENAKLDVKLIQHYEDDWIWDNFKVMSQAGGGNTATLTIDPASIYNSKFFPGVGDIIEFPNSDSSGYPLQARVTAIGANTISIIMGKAAWTVPATTDNQVLFVGTNLSAEGTGQPAAKRTTFNLYQNTFSRVKETVEMTGDAMTEALKWREYELINGKKITGVVSQTSMELDFRQMIAEQYVFLSGQRYDNLTQDGKTIEGTEGMFAGMRRASIQFPYTVFGMAYYDAIEKALSQVYAGQVTGSLQGINMDIASENILVDYFKHTDVNYTTTASNTALFGTGEEADAKAMAVGFRYIKKSKRVFAFKRFEALQNPKQYASTGYNYLGNAYLLPLKKNNVDPNTRMKVPMMRTIYRSLDGYDRQKEMFTTGSANVAKYGNTNDVDNRLLNARSQMGAEFFALAQWVNVYQN